MVSSKNRTARVCLMVFLTGVGSLAAAQNIYTCVDSKGRTLSADRPIAECIDRPQRELQPSGALKRQLGPTLTEQEQAAQDDKDRRLAEKRAREAEDRRRDRALLQRYPAAPAHDQARAAALVQVDEVIKVSNKRRAELLEQRKMIANDFEFYVKDPSRAPAALKRRLEENERSLSGQQKFIADQEQEKKRVNRRFDDELARLKQLWAMAGAAPALAASGPRAALRQP